MVEPTASRSRRGVPPARAVARRVPPARPPASARRDDILAAAAALFAERGFDGTGMDDLGLRLDMSGPALYKHFRSKQAILSGLLLGAAKTLIGESAAAVESADDPVVGLSNLIAAHARFVRRHADIVVVLEREGARLPPDEQRLLSRLRARYLETWFDAFEQIAPGLDRTRAEKAVRLVLGMIEQMIRRSDGSGASPPDETMCDLALHALTSPEVLRVLRTGPGVTRIVAEPIPEDEGTARE